MLKPLNRESAEKDFGLDKITRLKLVQRTNYFLKTKDLFRKEFVMKNGKPEESETFTFVPNVNKKDLPLDKKFPVYVEMEKQ